MNIASMIDHTLLRADAREDDIRALCAEALKSGFYSVCVNGCWVPLCADILCDSAVKVCCVVGFPLGAMSSEAKAFEAALAVKEGADEIDMVVNIGRLKQGDLEYVRRDIAAVCAAVSPAAVKVILETCLLTEDEIISACRCAEEGGAAFVKTSTGFSSGGATEQAVALMRRCVGDRLGVKASGGIRTHETALAMIKAGASRIGASAGEKLL